MTCERIFCRKIAEFTHVGTHGRGSDPIRKARSAVGPKKAIRTTTAPGTPATHSPMATIIIMFGPGAIWPPLSNRPHRWHSGDCDSRRGDGRRYSAPRHRVPRFRVAPQPLEALPHVRGASHAGIIPF